MEKIKLAILGTGKLARVIAQAWKDGFLEDYTLTCIIGRNADKTRAMAEEFGCAGFTDLDEALKTRPEYIAEAASVECVRENAVKMLSAGANLAVLSIGAFADAELYRACAEAARAHHVRVHIASGAVGGFDALRTVMLMGGKTAMIEAFKNPARFSGTVLHREGLENVRETTEVFSGTAGEAIAALPRQVNVAVAAALSTVGPEKMQVRISGVPGFVGDEHRITAECDGVRAVVDIYCSTSAIAGWSVVALLQNLQSPIMF